MAVYRVEFRPSAARDFATLPRDIQRRLARKIDSLALAPRQAGSQKLQGSGEIYRARAGDYRILYQIRDAVLLVLVVRIGHRKDVYR